MQSDFDVRKHLKIDKRRPVELRICHIAELWYGAVLSERMQNHLDTIYNLFPDLVIVEGYKSGDSDDLTPEFDRTTNYITAYRKDGYLNQAGGDVIPPIINCLYGSVKSPKQKLAAIDIQKRVSSELCRDISLLTDLRSHYTRLMLSLSPRQLDDFKIAFEKYINAVVDDLGKYPDYRTPLFPFSSDRLILDLNNYLSDEFKAGNYADFFLWMNLGALLRNEINGLIDTYDSSFNLRKEAGNLTGKQKENHDLLLRIFENDRKNHPSIRMMDPDPLLFPKGLPEIYSDGRFAVEEEEVPRALRDMILDSWKCEDRRHILLVGEGGIGKTVAMLTLPEEEWFRKLGIPVIYVPLQRLDAFKGDLNRYIREKIGSDNYERCLELANRNIEGHPRLLLLLDGFNEIPDKYKKDAGKYIREWMEKPGIQIITTSRLGFSLENSFSKYRLQPLSHDTVRSFLLSAGIKEEQLPGENDRVWEAINVPLMLTMYTQIEKVREAADRSSSSPVLEWKEPDNAAHIIWDYLQMELYRCIERDDTSHSVMRYATAIFAVAPYICCHMSRRKKFYIKREVFHELIRKALAFHDGHPELLDSQILVIRDEFDPYHEEVLFREEDAGEYAKILIDNIGLFQTQRTIKSGHGKGTNIDYFCSLMHQNLRDCLAAFFICSCLSRTFGTKEKKDLLDQANYYVKDYMAEHLSDRELVAIWDHHRKEEPEDGRITFILLDLIGRQRDYDYRELDFSGLDLTRTNLHRLLSKRLDICPLPIEVKKFMNTKISVRCFSPNGHAYGVHSVAFSPDGRQLTSAGIDRTVRVWNLESGESHVIMEGHLGDLDRCVILSPDGRQIASGNFLLSWVRVWDLASGELRVLEGHANRVSSVAFSADGRQVASGSADRTVRVWDLASGESHVLGRDLGYICSIAFSLDDRQVASGSEDRMVRVWDLASGESHVLEGHAGSVSSVAFSSDGRRVASGSKDRTVRVWDLASGESRVLEGHASGVISVAFSLDGRQVASGSDDNTVRVWDLASGESHVLEGHAGSVRSVVFSPDGRQVASGSDDNTVRVWDLASGGCYILGGHGRINSAAFSSGGRQLVGSANDGTVRVWDLASGESRVLEGHAGLDNSVAFSADGRQVASGSDDNTVRVWDLASGKSRVLEGHAGGVRSVAFSPDGRQVASGSNDRTVRVWDLASGENCVLSHLGVVRSVAFSADGRRVASGSDDRRVRIWDLESGEDRELRHISRVESIAFSPDGKQVASGLDSKRLGIWDLESGEYRVLGRDLGHICSIAFSPDGRHVASGSDDKKVRVWDLTSGEDHVLEGHAGGVRSVAFSPDGRQLASSGNDSAVRVWDLKEYIEVGKYVIIPHLNLSGANFELAIIDKKDKEVLRAAGARV